MDPLFPQNHKRQVSESSTPPPKRHQEGSTAKLPPNECISGLEANRKKVKAIFEDIFERYGRDFEAEADEIDIYEERIVIDRGFIRNAPYHVFGRGEILIKNLKKLPDNNIENSPEKNFDILPNNTYDDSSTSSYPLKSSESSLEAYDTSCEQAQQEIFEPPESIIFKDSSVGFDYEKTTQRIASLLIEDDAMSESSVVFDDLESIHSWSSEKSESDIDDFFAQCPKDEESNFEEESNFYEVDLADLENLSLDDFFQRSCDKLDTLQTGPSLGSDHSPSEKSMSDEALISGHTPPPAVLEPIVSSPSDCYSLASDPVLVPSLSECCISETPPVQLPSPDTSPCFLETPKSYSAPASGIEEFTPKITIISRLPSNSTPLYLPPVSPQLTLNVDVNLIDFLCPDGPPI